MPQLIALLGVAGLVCLIDQASKSAVEKRLRSRPLVLGALLTLRPVRGPTAGRNVLRGLTLLWLLAALSIAILIATSTIFAHPLALAGLGMALGGAGGNLIDRARRGHVLDFIDLRFWPVMNLADVAIVGGLLLAALTMSWPPAFTT